MNELLSLFNYPPGSARALLAGTLPLRYCTTRFAIRTPTWRLPVPGHVAGLVACTSWEVLESVAEGVGRRVRWVSGSGPNRRRIRLNRKSPAHLEGLVIQSRSRVWKRLRHVGHFSDSCSVQDWGGIIPWFLCRPTSPGLHAF